MTLDSEWVRMFVTSFSELSGRMGMATRPNAVVAKKATIQLGMLCDRIATLSPALIPYRDIRWESWSHLTRNDS